MGGEFSWEVFDDTFNAGKFRPALHMLLDDAPHEVRQTVVYWQKRAMCHLMLSDFVAAEHSLATQKKRPGWDESQQMAFDRDYALALIRRKKVEDLDRVFELALSMGRSSNVNEKACFFMIMGRMDFVEAQTYHGDKRRFLLETAAHFHKMAADMWDVNREEGVVWSRNNDYHHFKALRLQTSLIQGGDARKELFALYHRVLSDPNKKRRVMAHLIMWTGPLGLWVEDRFN